MSFSGLPEGQIGLYRDTGCDLAPKCLECPLPVCRYDEPQIEQRRTQRDRLMWGFSCLGMKRADIAAKFGVSLRTVDWAIYNRGERSTPSKHPAKQPNTVYKQRAPWPVMHENARRAAR